MEDKKECRGCYFNNEHTYQEVICNSICHDNSLNIMKDDKRGLE